MHHVVLWDMGSPDTADPFAGVIRPGSVPSPPPVAVAEPHVAVEDLDKSDVRALARDPQVAALAPVMPTALIRPVATPEEVDPVEDGAAWGVRSVGADVSGRDGAGVAVAVLDTGVDASHPAFAGVEVVAADLTAATGAGAPGDVQGHGTHCAGTLLGRDVAGVRIGVAPGVDRLLAGKVLSDDGSGDSDMIFRGVEWALQQGARVISMSLGFDFPGLVQRLVDQGWPADLATSSALEAYRANLRMFDSLLAMIRSRDAFGLGAVVVAAAGNESRREVDPDYEIGVALPGAAEGVVSAGALARSGAGLVVAPFSNTFPQLAAPGVGVLSARAGAGDLVALSGTSMATPHVAGAAALWWQEVLATSLPPTASVVTAKLLASAVTGPLAPGVVPADRGTGLVRCP
ncbi:MAG: S8 family serine peptidase [Kineosporiaceae bacterium]